MSKHRLLPAQQRTAGRGAAVGQPLAGDRMAVEIEARVEEDRVAHDQDVAGATELDETVALVDEAGAVGRQHVVGAADDDRGADAQTRLLGRGGAHLADDGAGHLHVQHRGPLDAGRLLDPRERVEPEVVEPALDRPVVLDVRRGAQTPGPSSRRSPAPRRSEPRRRARGEPATAPSGRRTAGRGPSRSAPAGRGRRGRRAISRISSVARASFWRIARRSARPCSSDAEHRGHHARDGDAGDVAVRRLRRVRAARARARARPSTTPGTRPRPSRGGR